MLKKIFIGLVILVILVSVIFVGSLYSYKLSADKNIKLCTETVYNIKNLEQDKKYTLKKDPNQGKLQIQIVNTLPTKNATIISGASVFGGSVFQGCWLQQRVAYNLLFKDKMLGYQEIATTGYVFIDNLNFQKYNQVLDKSIEYNFEEKFLNNFKIQTKNGLDLYTKVSQGFGGAEIRDDIVFVVENDSLDLIEIPRSLFPSDSGDRKNYTDFKKNGDKLEITFRLDDKMIQTLQDPNKEGFSKEEKYARLWQGGTYTFCFERQEGINKYILCSLDKNRFNKILSP